MQQDEEAVVDPEEQTERELVHYMALAVVAITAGGILFLALRPWIQRFRDEHKEEDGSEAAPGNEDVAAVEDRPPQGSSTG